jgi:hypothetical protein
LYFPETTYIYPAYRTEADTVEGEVSAYENRNECVVLRRGYGPWLVRRVVVDALKGRGWVERAEEAGTLLLCPPTASGARVRGLGWSGNFPQEHFYPWNFMGQQDAPKPAVTTYEAVSGVGGLAMSVLGALLGGKAGAITLGVGAGVTAQAAFSAIRRHVG